MGRTLLSALFFQSNRHRTYAQHPEQGFLQPQDRALKPPPGTASETFLPTFPGFPAILRLGSRSCVRLAIHVSALPAPRFTRTPGLCRRLVDSVARSLVKKTYDGCLLRDGRILPGVRLPRSSPGRKNNDNITPKTDCSRGPDHA